MPVYRPQVQVPVWDYDPRQWDRAAHADKDVQAEEKRPPAPPEKPPEPERPRSVVVFASSAKKQQAIDEDLSSSGPSDIQAEPPKKGPLPMPDRFPLDDELQRRVERLIDESNAERTPGELEPPRPYVRPAMRPRPPPPAQIPQDLVPPAHRPMRPPSPPKDGTGGDWRPRVVTMRDPNVIQVHDMTEADFRAGASAPKRKAELKEIEPKGSFVPRKRLDSS
jgi:hypothetical protein